MDGAFNTRRAAPVIASLLCFIAFWALSRYLRVAMTWIFAGIGLPKFVTGSISSRTTFVIYSMPSAKSGMYRVFQLIPQIFLY